MPILLQNQFKLKKKKEKKELKVKIGVEHFSDKH